MRKHSPARAAPARGDPARPCSLHIPGAALPTAAAVPKNCSWLLQVPMCGCAAKRGMEFPPFQGHPGGCPEDRNQHVQQPRCASKNGPKCRGKKDR